MKRTLTIILAFVAIIGASEICVNAMDNNHSETAQVRTHVHVAGNDDGYCSTCGSSKCPYFRPVSGANPTTCKCGHSKRSHVDSY